MLTREEIFVIYKAGPEAVISVIQRLENIIEEEQAVRIAELEKRVKIVEARLNQNSQNSSKPPSTDVFCSEKPKPKSSRTISDKKAGGQKGHPGRGSQISSENRHSNLISTSQSKINPFKISVHAKKKHYFPIHFVLWAINPSTQSKKSIIFI